VIVLVSVVGSTTRKISDKQCSCLRTSVVSSQCTMQLSTTKVGGVLTAEWVRWCLVWKAVVGNACFDQAAAKRRRDYTVTIKRPADYCIVRPHSYQLLVGHWATGHCAHFLMPFCGRGTISFLLRSVRTASDDRSDSLETKLRRTPSWL